MHPPNVGKEILEIEGIHHSGGSVGDYLIE